MGTYLKRWGPSFQRPDKLITPRLANARLADRVIVLEDGHGQASALPVVAAPYRILRPRTARGRLVPHDR